MGENKTPKEGALYCPLMLAGLAASAGGFGGDRHGLAMCRGRACAWWYRFSNQSGEGACAVLTVRAIHEDLRDIRDELQGVSSSLEGYDGRGLLVRS